MSDIQCSSTQAKNCCSSKPISVLYHRISIYADTAETFTLKFKLPMLFWNILLRTEYKVHHHKIMAFIKNIAQGQWQNLFYNCTDLLGEIIFWHKGSWRAKKWPIKWASSAIAHCKCKLFRPAERPNVTSTHWAPSHRDRPNWFIWYTPLCFWL